MNRKAPRAEEKTRAAQATKRRRRRQPRFPYGLLVACLVGGAIIALGALFVFTGQSGSSAGSSQSSQPMSTTQGNQYSFAVGHPGPGATAPEFRLVGTDGKTFDLTAQRGKTILLYFQEGVTCQPCWDQMKDIQAHWSEFQALHIDEMVGITSDPLTALKQKVSDEGISMPVLSDPNLAVSQTYTANQYGMMGTSRDGHTFLLVGPDGRILWRADYGGAPNYTMYVPVEHLLADLRTGLRGK